MSGIKFGPSHGTNFRAAWVPQLKRGKQCQKFDGNKEEPYVYIKWKTFCLSVRLSFVSVLNVRFGFLHSFSISYCALFSLFRYSDFPLMSLRATKFYYYCRWFYCRLKQSVLSFIDFIATAHESLHPSTITPYLITYPSSAFRGLSNGHICMDNASVWFARIKL